MNNNTLNSDNISSEKVGRQTTVVAEQARSDKLPCSPETSITLRDLAVGYGRKVILGNITADVYKGEMTCLIGDNGVGKSTLLRTLAGFQPRLHGEISFSGSSIDELPRRRMAEMISVVLTERPDISNLTVEEIVGLGRTPYTGFWGMMSDDDREIVHQAMLTVDIYGMAGRMIQTLSDGERQKVMIAKALAQQTPIIFLDEPTAFLDFSSKVETLRLLGTLAREMHKTVLLSTHDVEIALQIADRLWFISRNSEIVTGRPHELADEGIIARFVERDGINFDENTLEIKIHR